MYNLLRCLCLFAGAGLLGLAPASVPQAHGQENAGTQTNQKIPVMDGGVGPCSVTLSVIGADGKPVAAADVKVHVAYGFAGIRKLDLEAGTNSEGKVKFTGLPSKVRRPPLQFQASKGGLSGVATYNPESECEARHDITLSPARSSPEQ